MKHAGVNRGVKDHRTQVDVWNSCLTYLEREFSDEKTNTWLLSLSASVENDVMYLKAPNRFCKQHVELNFLPRINEIAREVSDRDIDVKVVIMSADQKHTENHINQKSSNANTSKFVGFASNGKSRKLPFGFGDLDPDFTFDQHVMGGSNQLARCAAERISENPGFQEYNPFFIYGPVGIGKTHLMHATGHALQKNFPGIRVGYVQSSSFVQHLVTLFKKKDNDTIESFKSTYRSLDALLIDDVHLFAGANASQQEFLHTFNTLLEGRKQIIITSDRFFKELGQVEDRLKSRFGQGLTISIKPPELETRIAILETKAERHNVYLEPQVSRYIAERVNSSVRELEGALNRIIANYRFLGHKITIQSVQQTLEDLLEFNSKPIGIYEIQKTVADYYDIKVSDLKSDSRRVVIIRPRQIAMKLARELTTESLAAIGKAFGNRDHTTVLHANKRIDKLLKEQPPLKSDFRTLESMLRH